MTITMSEESTPSATILAVAGEVDLSSAPALTHRLTEVLDGGATALVVDLSGVTFLDSTGLGALALAHRIAAKRGVQVVVARASVNVTDLFKITGLDRVITICPDVEAAVAATQPA